MTSTAVDPAARRVSSFRRPGRRLPLLEICRDREELEGYRATRFWFSRLPTTVDAIVSWTQDYEYVALDLGTGDGRSVARRAQRSPRAAVIGVDLCAANMALSSRKASVNARFLVADAILLPTEMIEVADQVTIAFPWGSLLRDILGHGDTLVSRLVRTMRPGAKVEIVINADAAPSCGMEL